MNAEHLLQHFERISEVPDAILRLRRFILDLAVRGKLVEQDPSDEPAEELLKRIQAERERRIRHGKMKKQEPLSLVQPDELWFRVPATWQWVRLGTVAHIVMGQSPPGETYNTTGEGLPLINGPVEFTEGPFGKTVVNQYTTAPTNLCEEGDLLLCVRGSTTGRTNIAAFRACIGRGVAAIQSLFDDSYVRLFVWRLRESIITIGRGIAFPSVSRKQIEELAIPLPPLAEQHRIVAKVDELMELCDQLEAAKTEREQSRDRLVAASLHRLNSPADTAETNAPDLPARQADAFHDHARFVFNHLPRLTTRLEHIKQLRQIILNLAVRGKLVPQDPNEEPAERLLEKITSERNTHTNFDSITKFDEDEFRMASKSLRLPDDWALAPLANVALTIVDCPHSTPQWVPSGMLCVRTNQFRPGFLDLSDSRFVSKTTFLERIQRLKPIEGDILYSREGGILGVACRVPPNTELCLGQRMMLIRPPSDINSAFLEMLLNSPLITEIAREKTTGGAAPRVNVSTVKTYPVPLPPLAEQHRIVARVDELMALCDQLEAQLTTTGADSRRLLEAVLHEALAPALEETA